jgi:hypothetical protein
MKTVIRLLVILLAAVAVLGATWAIGQNSASATDTSLIQSARPAPPAGFEGREGSDHDAAQVTSLQGWLGFVKTLVPLTIIITLITLPASLWQRYQRTRQHTAATAA